MKKKHHPDLIETIIIGIGKGLWFLIFWPIKKILKLEAGSKKLDKIANLQRWLEIEKLLENDDEIHAKHAVVEADKFFNEMMKQLGAQGEKFADRLRSLENRFTPDVYQSVWYAHKIRNQISHQMEYKLSIDEAQSALNKFRRGLVNLGAL